ncbi:MAG: hypothetical protein KJ556_20385 [Gammaproteobacteria bacterium]|nr:hypothetical protein [Gammaproteobacteria bacterium]
MVYIITDSKKKKGLSFQDNHNASEIVKIGHEINRAKAGGYNRDMIEANFGKDAQALMRKKSEPDTETKKYAKEIVDKLRS